MNELPESSFVQANGLRLHYLAWGEAGARPIVLNHATGFLAWLWEPVARPLVAAGYRVLAYDARGHGDSDKPAPTDRELRLAPLRGRPARLPRRAGAARRAVCRALVRRRDGAVPGGDAAGVFVAAGGDRADRDAGRVHAGRDAAGRDGGRRAAAATRLRQRGGDDRAVPLAADVRQVDGRDAAVVRRARDDPARGWIADRAEVLGRDRGRDVREQRQPAGVGRAAERSRRRCW